MGYKPSARTLAWYWSTRLMALVALVAASVFLLLPGGNDSHAVEGGYSSCIEPRPWPEPGPVIDVYVSGDHGNYLSMYPAERSMYPHVRRVYMEATFGEKYAIHVANRTPYRVGLVIAVDGRNIISGEKSYLGKNERMYILEPHDEGVFDGWRTSRTEVHRFYFSAPSESYSKKTFGDDSAMGVIAIAAFREEGWNRKPKPMPPMIQNEKSRRGAAPGAAPPSAEGLSKSEQKAYRDQEMGTGFGNEQYSPTRVVEFKPERSFAQKFLIKYETREALCRRGIVPCGEGNRLWDEGGFAPHPPPHPRQEIR